MNKARRKKLADLADKLSEIRDELESLRDEEQDAFGNLPESLQQSSNGERSQEAIDTLYEVIDSVASSEDAINGIEG